MRNSKNVNRITEGDNVPNIDKTDDETQTWQRERESCFTYTFCVGSDDLTMLRKSKRDALARKS